MDYDVAAAFEEIEADLIASMMRNFKRHRAEEDELGINWSQWQVEQLKALEEYKRHNAKKYGTKFNDINATLDGLIRKYREDGNAEQETKILEAMKNGFKAEKAASGVSAEFFKMNDRKIDALVNATTNDFKRAEIAILRRSNDQYRKIIFNAQMYAHMGGTYEKAVDMATKDFLRNGLKCVVYKNGSQHSLQDYADMALRTAQKRAYLTGEGEKRKEWGISTVIVNKRGNPCPLCAPWVGKVLVDDVWSGGSKDGKSNVTGVKYKTVSQAIEEGLYHPRCRDSHTTYFEGINTMPAEGYTKEELKKLAEDYKGEQQQQYAERQAKGYDRLAKYSLDEDNQRIYRARAEEWKRKIWKIRKKRQDKRNIRIDNATKISPPAKLSEISSEYKADIMNIIDEAPENIQRIINNNADNIRFAKFDAVGRSRSTKQGIFVNLKSDSIDKRGSFTGLFHEMGHEIDKIYNRVSHKDVFEKALRNDFEQLTENYMKLYNIGRDETYETIRRILRKKSPKESAIVSDLFGGLTDNKCLGKYGHDVDYWKSEHALAHEAFAHFFSATATNEQVKVDILKQIFPTAYEEFIKILDEMR